MSLVKGIEIRPLASVNALLRHSPANERDYQPKKRIFPYDMAAAASVLADRL
jgi:hypothetical protein